jgi:hypothetical protein
VQEHFLFGQFCKTKKRLRILGNMQVSKELTAVFIADGGICIQANL